MSYIPVKLTTYPRHPKPDHSSLPATYSGQRVVRGTQHSYFVNPRQSFVDPHSGAIISPQIKSGSKVMVKTKRNRRRSRRGKIRKQIPSAPFPSKIVRRLKTV